MNQYPDSIAITTYASSWQNASSGQWTLGASAGYTFNCRAEANDKGRQVIGDDGKLTDYTFQVFMPQTTTIISSGSDFVLTSVLNGVISGRVKRAHNGQLNSRLWL